MKYSEIGARIKARREELDVSAADLAARLSMSKATIHRYENGDIAKIKLPVVEAMACELNVTPGWLLGKSKVKEREREERLYPDLQPMLRKLIGFLRVTDVRCCGKCMDTKDKQNAISALKLIDDLIVSKYR